MILKVIAYIVAAIFGLGAFAISLLALLLGWPWQVYLICIVMGIVAIAISAINSGGSKR